VKVLIVSHLYPTPTERRSLFVHDQARALCDAGVEVRVVSPTGWVPAAAGRLDARLGRRAATPPHAVLDGIEVEYPRVPVLPGRLLERLAELAPGRARQQAQLARGEGALPSGAAPPAPLSSRAGELYYVALRRRLGAWRREGFDLIHAHQAMPDGAAARLLAADLGLPYVVTVHGVDVNVHLPARGALAAATAQSLRDAAAVAAVSTAVARRLSDVVAPARLHVIGNGMDLTPSTSATPEIATADVATGDVAVTADDGPLLLSVGHLIASKGHEVALEALASLADRYPGARYIVVGEGVLRDQLEARARELGLAERVRFLGHLPHEQVLELMSRATVFVLPSAPEGFGLVYAEAMTRGTPVIACRGEGPDDFVDDGRTGLLVPPRDPEALAAALDRLLADPQAAGEMGAAGKAAMADRTWAGNAAAMIEVYRAVVSGADARPMTHASTP